MIRTFQPIGQGNFVTEQFDKGGNVVFDCGVEAPTAFIKEVIRRAFDERELIDGVFISSIDMEHAEGLEFLLNWCRVEKVFLPYLHEDEKVFSMLKHLCQGGKADDFVGRLITDPKGTLAKYQFTEPQLPLLSLVVEETEKEKNLFDAIMPMYEMPWKCISGFRCYVDEEVDWIYQPRTYRQGSRIRRLIAKLDAQGVKPEHYASMEALEKAWNDKNLRRLIERAYEELDLPFCAVSMVLYGGPEFTDYPVYEQFTQEGKWSFYAKVRSGCLYTGNLKVNEEPFRRRLMHDFRACWSCIGCVLVPGHGSEKLYYPDLIPDRHCVAVATADNENETGEPHSKVIRNMMQRLIPFYLVTEMPGSAVRFYISEVQG